ncbi:MAG: hypothetical protein M1817_003011 [Caeruleum heppii]|nr:MAG: hypothetical protein M1817_003011 [Caeruleum heppii]
MKLRQRVSRVKQRIFRRLHKWIPGGGSSESSDSFTNMMWPDLVRPDFQPVSILKKPRVPVPNEQPSAARTSVPSPIRSASSSVTNSQHGSPAYWHSAEEYPAEASPSPPREPVPTHIDDVRVQPAVDDPNEIEPSPPASTIYDPNEIAPSPPSSMEFQLTPVASDESSGTDMYGGSPILRFPPKGIVPRRPASAPATLQSSSQGTRSRGRMSLRRTEDSEADIPSLELPPPMVDVPSPGSAGQDAEVPRIANLACMCGPPKPAHPRTSVFGVFPQDESQMVRDEVHGQDLGPSNLGSNGPAATTTEAKFSVEEPAICEDITPRDERTAGGETMAIIEPADGDESTAMTEPTDGDENMATNEPTNEDEATAMAEGTAGDESMAITEPTGEDEATAMEEGTARDESQAITEPTDEDETTATEEPTARDGAEVGDEPTHGGEATATGETTVRDEAGLSDETTYRDGNTTRAESTVHDEAELKDERTDGDGITTREESAGLDAAEVRDEPPNGNETTATEEPTAQDEPGLRDEPESDVDATADTDLPTREDSRGGEEHAAGEDCTAREATATREEPTTGEELPGKERSASAGQTTAREEPTAGTAPTANPELTAAERKERRKKRRHEDQDSSPVIDVSSPKKNLSRPSSPQNENVENEEPLPETQAWRPPSPLSGLTPAATPHTSVSSFPSPKAPRPVRPAYIPARPITRRGQFSFSDDLDPQHPPWHVRSLPRHGREWWRYRVRAETPLYLSVEDDPTDWKRPQPPLPERMKRLTTKLSGLTISSVVEKVKRTFPSPHPPTTPRKRTSYPPSPASPAPLFPPLADLSRHNIRCHNIHDYVGSVPVRLTHSAYRLPAAPPPAFLRPPNPSESVLSPRPAVLLRQALQDGGVSGDRRTQVVRGLELAYAEPTVGAALTSGWALHVGSLWREWGWGDEGGAGCCGGCWCCFV